MNICFIATIEYPGQLRYLSATDKAKRGSLGGGERRVVPLLKHAQKMGHQVTLVIPMVKSSDRYEVYDDVPIYRVGSTAWYPFKSNLYLSGSSLVMKTFSKVRNLVKNHDIDIIYIYNPTLICAIPGWMTAKLYHKPFILDINDSITQLQIGTGRMRQKSLLAKISLFVENNLPRRAEMVIATNLIGQMLVSQGMPQERISIIPQGVDVSIFHPGGDGKEIREKYGLGDSIVVLYQGEVSRLMGIDTLLEAMLRVSQKNNDVKLLIVGFPKNREIEFDQDEDIISFKRKAVQLRIEDRIVFIGPQPHETIPNFIAASDICVNPVPHTIVHRVASPTKIFEYMAVGKPVVATAMESVEGAIIDGKTGLLTKPDAEDIAEKILLLAENPGVREKIGRNARDKAVAEFAWEKIGDKVLDVFRQAMEKRVK